MAVSGLFVEGFELLVIGMGTVFIFLAVLVLAVSLMSKIARRFEPQPAVHGGGQDTVPAQHIAAITEAVIRYRATHGS